MRDQHRAALLITHDVEEAVSVSDRVIVLSHRPCRIRSVYDIGLEGDRAVDRLPRSGGVGSEHHAAARMSIPSMPARASAGVR